MRIVNASNRRWTHTRRYPPNPDAKKIIRIHIGDYYASRDGRIIYTLLGSCVAVCLWDPVARIGGMNHILMPGKADLKQFDVSARYGINAMELLINRIMNLGGSRKRLVAKIFGGARTLVTIPETHSMGPRNAEFVMEFLKSESIPIRGKDVGGQRSRRIFFHTDTGDVFLKRGSLLDVTALVKLEKKMQRTVKKESQDYGDVTLFSDDPE